MGFEGEGQVPWTAIDKYAERTGLDPEDPNDETIYDDLVYFVEQLDITYLKFRADQMAARSKKNTLKSDTNWG